MLGEVVGSWPSSTASSVRMYRLAVQCAWRDEYTVLESTIPVVTQAMLNAGERMLDEQAAQAGAHLLVWRAAGGA